MKKKYLIIISMLINIFFVDHAFAADRVSLGFIYGAKDSIALVDRTNNSINQVAPTCLNLDKKGNLLVTADLSVEFVEAMKERGIKVTPFLSNHWIRSKGKAALNNREELTNQLLEVVNQYNLDGINVDIENLTIEDRENFVEFVKLLKEKMPSDKIVSVSVAANPDGVNSGWQGSYDYEKLGKYADYLFIMAYDEHGQGGSCGPVSSYEFAEKSIQYALKYVSKDKIVLGIPFYGRFWKDDKEAGGEAIVIGAMPTLISKTKGVVKYEKEFEEATLKFEITEKSLISKINGIALEDGKYIVWYPTNESIKAKLKLVNKYDLLGAGVWALGQEKVDVWDLYKNELNRTPYVSEEETKKEEIRQKYEAMIIDLSKLQEPEIISLKDLRVTFNYPKEKNTTEEVQHIHVEEFRRINYIKTMDVLKCESKKMILKKDEIAIKEVPVYAKCKRYLLNKIK